ncbi:hypothetical protein N9N67_08775 [Bacteriovoracaceae bacterium]|nr:hypothetical protein [Bacteriovoracaceae bacterium]
MKNYFCIGGTIKFIVITFTLLSLSIFGQEAIPKTKKSFFPSVKVRKPETNDEPLVEKFIERLRSEGIAKFKKYFSSNKTVIRNGEELTSDQLREFRNKIRSKNLNLDEVEFLLALEQKENNAMDELEESIKVFDGFNIWKLNGSTRKPTKKDYVDPQNQYLPVNPGAQLTLKHNSEPNGDISARIIKSDNGSAGEDV